MSRARTLPTPPVCAMSGKVRYPSISAARVQAKLFAQELSNRREITQNLYAYPCGRCDGWHLSRQPSFDRAPSQLVYEAPDPEIQRWGWRR